MDQEPDGPKVNPYNQQLWVDKQMKKDKNENMTMGRNIKETGIIIPHEKLSAEALQGLLEDYVSRDGTDSGYVRLSLKERADQVRRQLNRGEAMIVFDRKTQTPNIVLKKDMKH